jgi:hypothetical protein
MGHLLTYDLLPFFSANCTILTLLCIEFAIYLKHFQALHLYLAYSFASPKNKSDEHH